MTLHRSLSSCDLLQHSFIVQLEIETARRKTFALFFYGKVRLTKLIKYEYERDTKIQNTSSTMAPDGPAYNAYAAKIQKRKRCQNTKYMLCDGL